MKKLVLLLFAITAIGLAQDTTVAVAKTYHVDSLTTAKDTIDLSFRYDENGYEAYSVTIYTDSGADTVNVYKLSADASRFVQYGVVAMDSSSITRNIIVSTTAEDYIVLGSESSKLRFISSSNDGSVTHLIVAIRKRSPIY